MQLKQLLEFLRFKISLFAAFSATSGYLLFNPLSSDVLLAALSTFLLCATVASYNDITDVKEDSINRKNINPLVYSTKGKVITAACMLLGLYFSFLLSVFSAAFFIMPLVAFSAYSSFRMKRYLFVKNIYTALASSLVFFIGAGEFTETAILYYLFVSGFVFIGSVISDIRDLDGDRAAGIRTIPIVFGEDLAKKFVHLSLLIVSILLIVSNLSGFFVLLPFAFLISLHLFKGDIITAHILIGVPFAFVTLWQVALQAIFI